MVAQTVKNQPANQETLGWEYPLEKQTTTHSSILAHRQRSLVDYSPWCHKESYTTMQLTPSLSII